MGGGGIGGIETVQGTELVFSVEYRVHGTKFVFSVEYIVQGTELVFCVIE